MEQRLTGRKGRLAVIPLWRQAAAIILLAGLGFWIYSAYFTNQTEQPPLAENDLYPGTDASLTGRHEEQPDVPHTDSNTDKPNANEHDAGNDSGTTKQALIPATETDEEINEMQAAHEGSTPEQEKIHLEKKIK